MGGCDLRYKGTGAELPPQQGDIIAQQFGECLLRAAQISLSRWARNSALRHFLCGKGNRPAHIINQQHGQPIAEQLHKGGSVRNGLGLGGNAALGQKIIAQSRPAAQHGRVAVQHIQRHAAKLFRGGKPCKHDDGTSNTCNHQVLGIKIIGTAKHFFQKRKVLVQRTVQRFWRHRCSPSHAG